MDSYNELASGQTAISWLAVRGSADRNVLLQFIAVCVGANCASASPLLR
jgi:hypothetical protein